MIKRIALVVALILAASAQESTKTITITLPAAILLNLSHAIVAENAKLAKLRGGINVPDPLSDEDFIAANVAYTISSMVTSYQPELAPRNSPDESQADWKNRVLEQYKSQIQVVVK